MCFCWYCLLCWSAALPPPLSGGGSAAFLLRSQLCGILQLLVSQQSLSPGAARLAPFAHNAAAWPLSQALTVTLPDIDNSLIPFETKWFYITVSAASFIFHTHWLFVFHSILKREGASSILANYFRNQL
jgi:hypothetical protein